ncbi:MAG TPA: hypothetical protein PKE67_04455 [Chitinophagales bacterium]|nr:hypothetical protein [Chitinophagales bacterium]
MKNSSLKTKNLIVSFLVFIVIILPITSCKKEKSSPKVIDVYVVGYENIGTKDVARIWKNGVTTSLTDGINGADANSVFVQGNDVYVAGYESNGAKYVAKIWKNGVATVLLMVLNILMLILYLFKVMMCMWQDMSIMVQSISQKFGKTV